MTRLDDWQTPFFAYIEECRSLPFEWGTHDCCTFAAGAIDALTGSTFKDQLAAAYSDETTALAYIASFGSLEAAVTSWLGPSEAPNSAGPGDIVLADLELGPAIGVCLGVDCAFSAEPSMKFRQRGVIACCWRIG